MSYKILSHTFFHFILIIHCGKGTPFTWFYRCGDWGVELPPNELVTGRAGTPESLAFTLHWLGSRNLDQETDDDDDDVNWNWVTGYLYILHLLPFRFPWLWPSLPSLMWQRTPCSSESLPDSRPWIILSPCFLTFCLVSYIGFPFLADIIPTCGENKPRYADAKWPLTTTYSWAVGILHKSTLRGCIQLEGGLFCFVFFKLFFFNLSFQRGKPFYDLHKDTLI